MQLSMPYVMFINDGSVAGTCAYPNNVDEYQAGAEHPWSPHCKPARRN